MKRGWRPLGALLLVVTILWFITGPMRTTAADGGRSSGGSSFWDRQPTTPTPTPSRPGSLGTPGTTGSGSVPRSGSGANDGGLFGVVEDAKKRWEEARSDSGPRSARPTWTPPWSRSDSGSTSGSGTTFGSGSRGDSGTRTSSGSATQGATQGAARAAAARDSNALTGTDADKIMLILDASGSMARKDDQGRTSMENAQHATANALESVPQGRQVGLRVFGSRVDGYGKPTPAACRDTALVQPLAPLNRQQMTSAVFSFSPLGETPIARSIDAAVNDLGPEGNRAILLVTDGEESCSPDPCRAVADARDAGVDVRVDIVGLRVDRRARDQLRCIARTTNGYYSEARSDSDLGGTLQMALDRLRNETAAASRTSASGTNPRNTSGSTTTGVANSAAVTATGAQQRTGFSVASREGAATALAFVLLLLLIAGGKPGRRR
ncbi:hypothetical protein BJY21_003037 [Kineosphaera limosa]|uniref:VWFA domain-containing protein n=1 Tax=Kineosphaera limosa NBRC 100340 TaxID=1184609 RepID=K6WSD2_9MICO|nr:VWA domain-containing protein [Kineosphaera limosa]NYE01853.1 hypothetical protein [Kineosphaera limosa]GAB96756.1 hypothetical protein KILIM_047_00180 [Kineosphaera limosa NBRC 100340]